MNVLADFEPPVVIDGCYRVADISELDGDLCSINLRGSSAAIDGDDFARTCRAAS